MTMSHYVALVQNQLGHLQDAVNDLADACHQQTSTPLHELVDLAGALDAAAIATTELARKVTLRSELDYANYRAARGALAECRLRLELLYAARPTPELEAVLATVATVTLEDSSQS